MKKDWSELDKFRIAHPLWGAAPNGATYGMFQIPVPGKHATIAIIIANDGTGGGWEHVSLHLRKLQGKSFDLITPSWSEMCWLKDLFWEPNECVAQLHPPISDYVNQHQNTLHLWRKENQNWELPPTIMV